MTATAHTVVHVNLGSFDVRDLLRADHPDGRVSFRVVDDNTQVWITGHPDDFAAFAADMWKLFMQVSPNAQVLT